MVYENKDMVNEQFNELYELSNKLHAKKIAENGGSAKKVIVFVGAGSSKAAGLPLGEDLKDIIYNKFVGKDLKAKEIFDAEYKLYKGTSKNFDLDALTLFEFAAILSRFAYGKKIITETIKNELKKASHRPLSYELLSHFAKHRYIDHFIILNFDRLLCEALEDEFNENDLKIIKAPEDIPLKTKDDKHVCYAVYPFGLLGEASRYSLTTDDVAEFGPEPIRDLIKNKMFNSPSGNSEPIILLMVGYRGVEPAFEQLLHSISDKDRKRNIDVFVINPMANDTRELCKLKNEGIINNITQINLGADLAFELLFELLKYEWGDKNLHSWISAARHRILSKLFNCANMPPKERFVVELLLQGVKSRGFVHFETFGKIPRLLRYSDGQSAQAIKDLLKEKLLKPDKWFLQNDAGQRQPRSRFYVPNYTISGRKIVSDKFIQLSQRTNSELGEWHLNRKSKNFVYKTIPAINFLMKELGKIQKAPDIEIVRDVEPEVKWVLGNDKVQAEALLSIDLLKKRTVEIISPIIEGNKDNLPVVIHGIWSTGEWLFWKDAWAENLGSELLKKSNVTLKVLITKAGGKIIVRSNRRKKVIERLLNHKTSGKGAKIELKWINWWEMNRILTIVSHDSKKSAIHMRRRLNNPLVCPYYIPSEAKNAMKYLDELWKLYWSRGETIS